MQNERNYIHDLSIKNKIEDIKSENFDLILEKYSIKKHIELFKPGENNMIYYL